MPNYKEIPLYNGQVTIKFDEDNHRYWLAGDKMERLRGVTTIINILDKPALIPWAVNVAISYVREHLDELQFSPAEILRRAQEEHKAQRDLAAETGNAIHAWISKHLSGDTPDMPDEPQILAGVNAFLGWAIEKDVKFKWTERVVYSRERNFIGTADIGVEIGGLSYLVDIKTGNDIYSEVRLQTAAYMAAYNEELDENSTVVEDRMVGRYVLRISKESESEYLDRQAKAGRNEFKPYQVFEAVYLDDDDLAYNRDLDAFNAANLLYQWKQDASKSFNNSRKNGYVPATNAK
jgi:hypothetical protein